MKFFCLLLSAFLSTPLLAFQAVDCTRAVRPANPTHTALPSSIPRVSPGKFKAAQAVNFIDEILFAVQNEAGLPRAPLCDDLNFLRRVTLDLTGRLPSLEQILSFLEDTGADKREIYVDEILASEAFVERWAFWFGELFQNTGLVGGDLGAHRFAAYLRDVIRDEKSLDQLANELLTTRGGTFYDGVPLYLLRQGGLGVTSPDRVENEVSAVSAQLLGIDTNCISCHDGRLLGDSNLFLSKKKRADLWSFAAFMVSKRFEVRNGNVHTFGFNVIDAPERVYIANSQAGMGDRPPRNGGQVSPKYLFTGEQPAEGEPTHDALARMITTGPQFARNFANRFWAHFMSQGLVEPLDAFDLDRLDPTNPPPEGQTLQPTQPALLEALAQHMRDTGYDIKSFFRTLTRSATYQLSSQYPIPWEPTYAAYHPKRLPRRLTGEEVLDQLISSNGTTNVYNNIAGWANYYNDQGSVTRHRFSFVHQLTDISKKGTASGFRNFLQGFGVGNRYDLLRTDDLSPTQALLMMNHYLVNERLDPGVIGFERTVENGNVVHIPRFTKLGEISRLPISDREKVRLLFLNTLVREPGAEEMRQALRLVAKRHFSKAAGDLQWVLYNYDEFRLGY